MPVLATFFSVRRGRDPFFKFFMRKMFPRQVDRYEKEFGVKFLGWYNVAYGWDFDNVILLELPDYGTIDRSKSDERSRASATAPASGCSNAIIRCSCASAWEPISSTTPDELTPKPPPPNEPPPPMSFRRQIPNEDTAQGQGGRADMSSMPGALGEIAADASLERNEFLSRAGEQLKSFLEANKDRIKDVGGLVLIDDDPDYLSVAPDGSFRSRTRYQDELTGEWRSETEVIESAAELVELYNPAEIFAAFAEAAREQAGLPAEPTATDDLMDVAGIAPDETVGVGVGGDELADEGYAGAADQWARGQDAAGEPTDAEDAARRLYDLALTFQERSQHTEARLIEQFESLAQTLTPFLGDLMVLDDEDERLWLKRNGRFEAEVVPEREEDGALAEGDWRRLEGPDDLVEFYDPTDVFGDLAEALAESFPGIAADEDDADDEEVDDAKA